VSTINWAIVRTSVLAGAAVTALAVVSSATLAALGAGATGRLWLFAALIVAAFAVTGVAAGRPRPPTPVLHGGISALLVCGGALLVGVIAASLRSEPISWAAVPVAALLALTTGVAGAILGDRYPRTN
jgi:hypothetical protein